MPNDSKPKIEEISDEQISDKSQFKTASDKSPLSNSISSEDVAVQQLLANPEIRSALLDPKVQTLIELLKTDPEQAQRSVMYYFFTILFLD